MKYLTLLSLLLFFSTATYTNDGAYYISGNQLMPIIETDIAVKKEILSIKRKNKRQVDVSVYYEFYNPGKTKSIIVGFEAFSPSGDVNPNPKNGQHPNIYDFTVNMNNVALPYEVAIVKDSIYFQNGKFKSLNRGQIEDSIDEYGDMGADFFYVYHFTANFKNGLNIVKHTYTCDLSGSVDYTYSFDYVLTAATRWGNKQIDDFTLIIDMGEFQDFYIDNAPFDNAPKWEIRGTGTLLENTKHNEYTEYPAKISTHTDFLIKKGDIMYKQLRFKPKEELRIRAKRPVMYLTSPFNYKETPYLSLMLIDDGDVDIETRDETSKKILRNLPFARKGYIFSNPDLKKYYAEQPWYTPNPAYKSSLESLTKEEKEWVKRYSK